MENGNLVGLGFCSNDYPAPMPENPIDSKVQIPNHLVRGTIPADPVLCEKIMRKQLL